MQILIDLIDFYYFLIQEAHNMVKEANLRQAAATRALKESSMKVDVLSAEVAALKTLVLTSTPSHPNLSREDSISMPGITIHCI